MRIIFEMYDNGFGYNKLIDELNTFGYRTKRGGPFGKNSIHEILKNEKYIGIYTFNKRQGRTMDGCKNNRRQKSKDEVIRIPGAIPPIVNEELFNRVQERMLKRKQNPEKARQKAKTIFLLTGQVFCGVCGTAYIGNTATNNGTRYGYYECGARDRTRTCTNRRIRKNVLEGIVLDEIDKSIFASDVRPALVNKIIDFYSQLFSQSNNEAKHLEKEFKRVQTAINNLLQVIERGQVSEALLEQLSRREQEAALLQQELNRMAARTAITLTKKDVERYLDDLYEKFKDKENEELIKPLVQQFVNNVTIFEDEIEVVLKIFLVTNGGGGGS